MPDDTTASPLITGGELILYGYVGGDPLDSWFPGFSGRHVVDALAEMSGDITVRINSGGGSVWDGFAVYNALKAYDGRVTVKIDGVAASAASVIAMAGDDIIAPLASMLMIHDASGITIGNADEHRQNAAALEKFDSAMADIYAARTGQPRADIVAMMDFETWLTATEAVELGFATAIEAANDEDDDEAASATAAVFPYHHLYTHAPAKLAAVASAMPDEALARLSDLILCGTRTNPAAASRRPQPAARAALPSEAPMPKMTPAPEPGDQTVDVTAATTAAVKAERDRARDIRSAVAKAKLQPSFADELIEAGVDISVARERIIDALADADETVETRSHTRVEVGLEARDKFRLGAEAAVLAKLGYGGERNEFSSMSLMELARASLEQRNIRLPGTPDRMTIAGAALNPMAYGGQHSTDDFAEILGNVANKAMLKGWDETPESFEQWTARGTATDFKPITRVDLNAFPSLASVAEGAEYSYGTIGERKETVQLATYGKKFAITRQAIINDDLGLFDRMPRKMGRAARRTVGNLVYAILTSNPTMGDGTALFHADHSNLAGSGGALSVATMSAGRVAMATHTDPDDNAVSLNIRPAYVLVPMAIEDTARVLAASEFDPAKTQRTPNPHRGTFEVIADARLDAASATAWYLAASAAAHDTIEVTYLDGQDTPVIEQKVGWEVDGIEMKVRMDAAATALDYRTLYKNPGA